MVPSPSSPATTTPPEAELPAGAPDAALVLHPTRRRPVRSGALSSYVGDHAAMARAACELVHRMRSAPRWNQHAAELDEVADLLDAHEAAVDRYRRGHELAPARLRRALAVVGERVGRVKPNGTLFAQSAATPLVELDGLAMLTTACRRFWSVVGSYDDGLEQAQRQQAALGAAAERVDAITAAVAGSTFTRRGPTPTEELQALGEQVGAPLRLWTVGAAKGVWQHVTRRTPIHRSAAVVDGELGGFRERVDALPGGRDRLQGAEDGVGPQVRRTYEARIVGTSLTAERIIEAVAGDPNVPTPSDIAMFERRRGTSGELAIGDEYLIRISGPWNAPVRVIARDATSFRFATLAGHMEAGEIEFRARQDGGAVVFTITSWARSGDRWFSLLYDRIGIAREVQLSMWASFLEGVARLAEGSIEDGIHVATERSAVDGN